jgi:hypothetical protein
MKRTPRTLLAAAAMAGLLNGATMHQARADDGTNNASTNSVSPGSAVVAEPTLHGCSGVNACKGTGGCKSGDAGCKFLNSCKGKGGCEITAKDIADWKKKHAAKG